MTDGCSVLTAFLTTVVLFLLCCPPHVVMVSSQEISDGSGCPSADNPQVLEAQSMKQQFLTPGYTKGRYPSNADCHWIVRTSPTTAGQKNRVQLTVTNSQFEDRLFGTCDDMLEVLDGETRTAPLIARWCGYAHPLTLTSDSGSLYIHLRTDATYELRGANLSFQQFPVPGCPPEWYLADDQCYKLFSPYQRPTWVEAQRQCNYDRANLLTVRNALQYRRVLEVYGKLDERPWVGYTDAAAEDRFKSVDPTDPTWPNPFPTFSEHELKDCLVWDSSIKGAVYYGVADCRDKRPFICKRSKDAITIPYPPPEEAVRQSYEPRAQLGGVAPWNVVLPVALLLAILLCLCLTPLCYKKTKRRSTARVNVAPADDAAAGHDATHVESNGRLVTATAQSERDTLDVVQTSSDSNHHQTQEELLLEPRALPPPPPSQNGRLVVVDAATSSNELAASSAHRYVLTRRGRPNGDVTSTAAEQRSNGGSSIFLKRNLQTHNTSEDDGLPTTSLPPLETRFDRPRVRMLDNVSAISMDEFWSRPADRNSPYSGASSKTPSREGRTIV